MEERIVSVDDLAAEGVEIVKVTIDNKGGVMYIGSLTAEDYIEWLDARNAGTADARKGATAQLIVRSLVKGPDKNKDGTSLSAADRKGAEARVGTPEMVPLFKKIRQEKSERLLRAIFTLNGLNAEAAVKNG